MVGAYASFVLVNILFWVAAALATYALAVRFTGSNITAVLAALRTFDEVNVVPRASVLAQLRCERFALKPLPLPHGEIGIVHR